MTEENVTLIDGNETATGNETAPEPGIDQTIELLNSFVGSLPLESLAGVIIIALAVILVIALLTIIVYALYIRKQAQNEQYEKKKLEEFVLPDIKNALKRGVKETQKVRYNLHTLGVSYRDTRFNEFDDLEKALKDLSNRDGVSFSHDSINELQSEIDGEKLVKEGLIDSEEKKELENNNIIPHRLLEIRDEGLSGLLRWYVKDQMLDTGTETDYYLVPEVLLIDGGDHLQIPRNIQFRNIGGVEIPLYRSSMAMLPAVNQRHLVGLVLEDLWQYTERMNASDPEFRQEYESMIKKLQLENEKNQKGIAGDINKS